MTSYYDQVIEAAYLHSRPNCYFVGPYARRVSFASQQHRAVDLVTALNRKGKLSGKKIAVVGAGVAGVTAAAVLRGLGLELDLYESESDAILMQKDAKHRVIHPSISRWPAERLDLTTKFRVLDWAAGPCSRAVENLRNEWLMHLKPDGGLRFLPNRRVVKLLCDRRRVTFQLEPDSGENPPIYDLAFITTGYGTELKIDGAVNVSYWKPDQIDSWRASRRKVVVSGCGDGGLIDALRLVHGRFDDGRLALELAHLLSGHDTITKEICEAEDDALLAAKSIKCVSPTQPHSGGDRTIGKPFEDESVVGPLSNFYERLATQLPNASEELLLASYKEANVTRGFVTLVSLQSRPFGPYAAPIHKLMVAHAMREFFIEYKTVEVKAGPVFSPAGFDAASKDVVVRHGANSNLETLLEQPERDSLRIRQFLLADYIDNKEEHNFNLPPLSLRPGTEQYIASRHSMANELVGWMKNGVTLTARGDGYYLDGGNLSESGLGVPESLFGIPLRQANLPTGVFF